MQISIKADQNGHLLVEPSVANAVRGGLIQWTTSLRAGATIVPLQGGLTILKRTAYDGSPAEALGTNTGYYQYDVYSPAFDAPNGAPLNATKDPERITAILIVSDYLLPGPVIQGGAE